MAARVVAGWNNGPDEGITSRMWSVTVFFENYLCGGASGTQEEFGPREAVELKPIPTPERAIIVP